MAVKKKGAAYDAGYAFGSRVLGPIIVAVLTAAIIWAAFAVASGIN